LVTVKEAAFARFARLTCGTTAVFCALAITGATSANPKATGSRQPFRIIFVTLQ
ncbi:MAG: hypothetical protein H7145_16135, partial [Akkermansiaceae bacterium]|nr:hypothetical protein [Armatimonadota bacterium]